MSATDNTLGQALPVQSSPRTETEPVHKWPATIAVMLGMMTTIMASTMANVAIADIMGAYGVGQDRAHWISSGFLSATTVCMLFNAWAVHNFGARRTLMIATVIFTVASIVGQLSPTFGGIVMARVAQGACAGIIQPLALSVIYTVFPPEERGKAMGMFGVGVMLGPALGPIYGGFIIDTIGWRYVFTGALPFMIIGAVLGWRYLPDRAPRREEKQLNWLSLILVTFSIGAFLNGISLAPRYGWDSLIVVYLLAGSGLAMVAFIEVENRTAHPLLNVRLFTIRSFTVVSLVGFVFGMGMFASFYLMPLFLRTAQGFTGTKTGGLLLLSELVTFMIFPIAGWLIQRVNPVYPVAVGMALFGASSLALTQIDVDSSPWFLNRLDSGGSGWTGSCHYRPQRGRLAGTPSRPHFLWGWHHELHPYDGRRHRGQRHCHCSRYPAPPFTRTHFTSTQVSMDGPTQTVISSVVNVLAQQGASSAERAPYAMIYLGDMITARSHALSFQDAYLMLAVAFFLATCLALTMARVGRPRTDLAK